MTLVPIFDDTYPLRTLTITDNDKTVAIGRASKRETRKRSPATENAWFESRVMSRDHAYLNIPPDQNVSSDLHKSDYTASLTSLIDGFHYRLWLNARNILE